MRNRAARLSDPAKPKRSQAANLKRPSWSDRFRVSQRHRVCSSGLLERPSGAEPARSRRRRQVRQVLAPQRSRSGLRRQIWTALTKLVRAANFERPNEAERVPAADSRGPAMPSGARRAGFEHSDVAERARAASSGPELANVGRCSVFEADRVERSSGIFRLACGNFVFFRVSRV